MIEYGWKVVPLCERQLRDVNPQDIIMSGLYRKCGIYKSGGGYDKFEDIYKARHDTGLDLSNQFVVQLYGCSLKCLYCYVTYNGIWGDYYAIKTSVLVKDFMRTGLDVFYLMGGAPALYMKHWTELIECLESDKVFHSDMLLIEGDYDLNVLKRLAEFKNTLYAVSIKGCDADEFRANTGVDLIENLLWSNLGKLVSTGIDFYLTFTGMSDSSIEKFCNKLRRRFPSDCDMILRDSFSIQLIEYNALK